MRKDTKEDPVIGREVMTVIDIMDINGTIIKKGTICYITGWVLAIGYSLKSENGITILCVLHSDITDDFKLTITHYEYIKDGRVLLSSDEEIEVESIEEFKKNAHKLIVCDDVKVEYKAEAR